MLENKTKRLYLAAAFIVALVLGWIAVKSFKQDLDNQHSDVTENPPPVQPGNIASELPVESQELDCEAIIETKKAIDEFEDLWDININTANFTMLENGSRHYVMPDGSLALTEHHKYLQTLTTNELERIAESGDKGAMVSLTHRYADDWQDLVTGPLAEYNHLDYDNKEMIAAVNTVDLLVDDEDYKKAKEWALRAGEKGALDPVTTKLLPALENQAAVLKMRLSVTEDGTVGKELLEKLQRLEGEYYHFWRLDQLSTGKIKIKDEANTYEPEFLSPEQMITVKQKSEDDLAAFRKELDNQGAMLLYEMDQHFIAPEANNSDVKAITAEELATLIGDSQYALYTQQIDLFSNPNIVAEKGCNPPDQENNSEPDRGTDRGTP